MKHLRKRTEQNKKTKNFNGIFIKGNEVQLHLTCNETHVCWKLCPCVSYSVIFALVFIRCRYDYVQNPIKQQNQTIDHNDIASLSEWEIKKRKCK